MLLSTPRRPMAIGHSVVVTDPARSYCLDGVAACTSNDVCSQHARAVILIFAAVAVTSGPAPCTLFPLVWMVSLIANYHTLSHISCIICEYLGLEMYEDRAVLIVSAYLAAAEALSVASATTSPILERVSPQVITTPASGTPLCLMRTSHTQPRGPSISSVANHQTMTLSASTLPWSL